jgi:hypothetical protein
MNTNYQKVQHILFLEDGKTAEELEAETIERLRTHQERDKWYRYAGALFGGARGAFHNVYGSHVLGSAIGAATGFGVAYIITKIAHFLQRQSYDACKRKYGSTGDEYNACKREAIEIVIKKLESDKGGCDTDLCRNSIDREVERMEKEKETYPV